ncbi:hypothetical protein ATANTOWER_003042, partial [Ataeniobius toweri]|nr:hypothetical protein [Ataeniobius toweri]
MVFNKNTSMNFKWFQTLPPVSSPKPPPSTTSLPFYNSYIGSPLNPEFNSHYSSLAFLSQLLRIHTPSHSLRSSSSIHLSVPSVCLSTMGGRVRKGSGNSSHPITTILTPFLSLKSASNFKSVYPLPCFIIYVRLVVFCWFT